MFDTIILCFVKELEFIGLLFSLTQSNCDQNIPYNFKSNEILFCWKTNYVQNINKLYWTWKGNKIVNSIPTRENIYKTGHKSNRRYLTGINSSFKGSLKSLSSMKLWCNGKLQRDLLGVTYQTGIQPFDA